MHTRLRIHCIYFIIVFEVQTRVNMCSTVHRCWCVRVWCARSCVYANECRQNRAHFNKHSHQLILTMSLDDDDAVSCTHTHMIVPGSLLLFFSTIRFKYFPFHFQIRLSILSHCSSQFARSRERKIKRSAFFWFCQFFPLCSLHLPSINNVSTADDQTHISMWKGKLIKIKCVFSFFFSPFFLFRSARRFCMALWRFVVRSAYSCRAVGEFNRMTKQNDIYIRVWRMFIDFRAAQSNVKVNRSIKTPLELWWIMDCISQINSSVRL